MIIEPNEGVVLVELPTSEWGNIPVPEKPHDSLTGGMIIAINPADSEKFGHWNGRMAHWRKYKDDARIKKNLALIEIKDILGTSYESTETANK